MNAPTIELVSVSKWYGEVLGLRDVSIALGPGVTGLLGPNGAGKSTFLKCITGELRPSRGEVRLLGRRVPSLEMYRQLGCAPEIEVFFEELTAREFVVALGEMSGLSRKDAGARAEVVLHEVGMSHALDRPIATYSKGMRQRTKLAQALLHDPPVVLLDEPMTGLDPVGRAAMLEMIQKLGAQGRTVLVSSHILDEVESMTHAIVVLYQGQLLAQGDLYAIRAMIDRHPHRLVIECDKPRVLAQALSRELSVSSLRFQGDAVLEVETHGPDACYAAVPALALREGVKLRSLRSPDDNLGAVFKYLTEDPRKVRAEAQGGPR
ncbi:MAG: ABC transporter ATP-binding protein [Myxococcales bacterium]|nr:ABC transporter ATP-binding protein [Myxococcales bacterium]